MVLHLLRTQRNEVRGDMKYPHASEMAAKYRHALIRLITSPLVAANQQLTSEDMFQLEAEDPEMYLAVRDLNEACIFAGEVLYPKEVAGNA